jgi:hypothetical protein
VQLARAARIVFRQLAGIETRVSHVATPAAGDPDFLQEVRAFLEDRHASPRSHFRVLQRGEKARRAAADHGKVEWRSRWHIGSVGSLLRSRDAHWQKAQIARLHLRVTFTGVPVSAHS